MSHKSIKASHLLSVSTIAVAVALVATPVSFDPATFSFDLVKAEAKGGNGGGNSGGNGGGNSGGNGGGGNSGGGNASASTSSFGGEGSSAKSGSGHGKSGLGKDNHGSLASALGGLNAAHASEKAFEAHLRNGNTNSIVGKIAVYQEATQSLGILGSRVEPLEIAIQAILDEIDLDVFSDAQVAGFQAQIDADVLNDSQAAALQEQLNTDLTDAQVQTLVDEIASGLTPGDDAVQQAAIVGDTLTDADLAGVHAQINADTLSDADVLGLQVQVDADELKDADITELEEEFDALDEDRDELNSAIDDAALTQITSLADAAAQVNQEVPSGEAAEEFNSLLDDKLADYVETELTDGAGVLPE